MSDPVTPIQNDLPTDAGVITKRLKETVERYPKMYNAQTRDLILRCAADPHWTHDAAKRKRMGDLYTDLIKPLEPKYLGKQTGGTDPRLHGR